MKPKKKTKRVVSWLVFDSEPDKGKFPSDVVARKREALQRKAAGKTILPLYSDETRGKPL